MLGALMWREKMEIKYIFTDEREEKNKEYSNMKQRKGKKGGIRSSDVENRSVSLSRVLS